MSFACSLSMFSMTIKVQVHHIWPAAKVLLAIQLKSLLVSYD